MSSLDQSLGDIISAKRDSSKGSRRGGSGGGNRRGGRGGGGGRDGGDNNRNSNSNSNGGNSSHPLDRRGDRGDRSSGPVRRDRQSGGGGGRPYERDTGSNWQRGAAVGNGSAFDGALPITTVVPKIVGDTVRVSNLASGMTRSDLEYVFQSIGQLKDVRINYDASGRSNGTAEVQFQESRAAETAVRELDQAEVDGRIMYVALVGQVVNVPQVVPQIVPHYRPSVLPAQQRRDNNRGDDDRRPRDGGRRDRDQHDKRDRRDGGGRGQQQQQQQQQKRGGDGARGGGRGGRGGRGGGRGRDSEKPASIDDLNRELESYHQTRASEGGAAAASAAPASKETAQASSSSMEA